MDLTIEPGSTPSLLPVSDLLARYAGMLERIARATGCHEQSRGVLIATDTRTVMKVRDSRSAAEVQVAMSNDTQLCIHEKVSVATPIQHHMNLLFSALVIHKAMMQQQEGSTDSAPWIALKGSRNLSETISVATRSNLIQDQDSIAGVPLTDEVSAFASVHAIRKYLADTIRIIRETFPIIELLKITYEHDAESEGEWLSVQIKTAGDVEQVLSQYDSFIKEFNRLIPWPSRSLIRLNYAIAE